LVAVTNVPLNLLVADEFTADAAFVAVIVQPTITRVPAVQETALFVELALIVELFIVTVPAPPIWIPPTVYVPAPAPVSVHEVIVTCPVPLFIMAELLLRDANPVSVLPPETLIIPAVTFTIPPWTPDEPAPPTIVAPLTFIVPVELL